jgi:hypothetical protein
MNDGSQYSSLWYSENYIPLSRSYRLNNFLQTAPTFVFAFYAIVASLCTYSCMYAFRKPFAVATFEGIHWLGVDYKIWLIIAQGIGYMVSKFAGIKIISEMKKAKRALAIILLILSAWIFLFLFAIIPPPWNIIFMFLNGLPLGMVWGIVFSYLEGRNITELLGAGLSMSFIISSGLVKSIGKWLMLTFGTSEFWMPFATGALFAFPLILFVWMLDRLPPPNANDIQNRTRREPMTSKERIEFFSRFALGLVLLILTYALLTAFRDFRDNFSAEMWNTLGYGKMPAIFTLTEIPVAISVLLIISLIMLVKDNKKALMLNFVLIIIGFLLTGMGTLLFSLHLINAPFWMILTGAGLYLGYVPFNAILFDRLIAVFKIVSNAGFLIYLADSFGYLGSIGVLMYKNFGQQQLNWLNFFKYGAYISSTIGILLVIFAWIYFSRKTAAYSEGLQLIEHDISLDTVS